MPTPEAPAPEAPTPEAPLVWTQPFHVRAYEVGPGDVASPLAIVDYFQEAAGEHAAALGIETFKTAGGVAVWALSRIAMEIDRLPRWRDPVTVETWPSGREGLRATRDLVLRGASGEALVRARTVWFVLDLARRRPVRLPPAVHAIQPPKRPAVLALGAPPEAPDAPQSSRAFTVGQADVDRNGHANHARFAAWALEAAPGAPPFAGLRALDLAFRAEAVLGDRVVSEASRGPAPEALGAASGGAVVRHAILHAETRRPLALARTRWT